MKLEAGTVRCVCEIEFRCQNEQFRIGLRLDFMQFQLGIGPGGLKAPGKPELLRSSVIMSKGIP